jgi:hypothetical protein
MKHKLKYFGVNFWGTYVQDETKFAHKLPEVRVLVKREVVNIIQHTFVS